MYEYKKINNFEYRFNESNRILNKYKDKYPLIVEKSKDCIYDIQKNKYLVPKDIKIHQLQFIIRKRLDIKKSEALFIYINNTIPPSNSLISEIYDNLKDEDGFLYITYSNENTFG
tara:strand:- start:1438 stop:1782 length:345 start_codon:yes stop_codon:yes gene_type:complete